MTDDVFAELDRAVGPVAMMSLQSRGLLPAAGVAGDEALPERDLLMDRVAGALLGAAIGNALGRVAERKQRQRGAAGFVSTEWLEGKRLDGSTGKVRAGVQQLVISGEALLTNGVGAAPVVSDELVRRVRRLRVPGRAIVATVEQRRAGLPWFEAGAGSFGEGALCRAVAAGLVFANDPVRRPVIAALDAAVTHASTQAIQAATVVADTIASLIRGVDLARSTLDLDAMLATVSLDQQAESTIAAALAVVGAFPGEPVRAITAAASVPGNADTVRRGHRCARRRRIRSERAARSMDVRRRARLRAPFARRAHRRSSSPRTDDRGRGSHLVPSRSIGLDGVDRRGSRRRMQRVLLRAACGRRHREGDLRAIRRS